MVRNEIPGVSLLLGTELRAFSVPRNTRNFDRINQKFPSAPCSAEIIFFSENGNPSHNTMLCLLYSLLVHFESFSLVMDKFMTRVSGHFVFVISTSRGREWMYYRVPNFLAVLWLGSSPSPSVSRLSFFLRLPVCMLPIELTDRRGGGEGAKIQRRESLFLCNHLILSVQGVHDAVPFLSCSLGEARFLKTTFGTVVCTVHKVKTLPPLSLIHSCTLSPLSPPSADAHTEQDTET
jgi:hypothetical protein